MNKLYHVDVYMPEWFTSPIWVGNVTHSRHAINAAQTDRYGVIDLPNKIDYTYGTIIEVETEFLNGDEQVIKQVWRIPYDDVRDLIIVVTTTGLVKTVWFNLKNDKHKTLNRSKYVRG